MSDWDFCKQYLVKLSRSFSIPIGMLDDALERVVTCGYLLCRIVDTVEDRASILLPERDALYKHFIEVMEQGLSPEIFEDAFARIVSKGGDDDDEATLAGGLGRVLAVLESADPEAQTICRRWVVEMTRGMVIYSHRSPGPDGVTALTSLADLERYCYFVAGTVGHMLTDLFIWSMKDSIDAAHTMTLRENSEGFGTGLQLVNIIKDMSEDINRNWCFMPRTGWNRAGIDPRDMLNPEHRTAAHAAVAHVFEAAWGHLDEAFAYTQGLPKEAREIRLFCLVPLWMAAATLYACENNDDLFLPERKVKISRAMVMQLVQQCTELCQDDAALLVAYRALQDNRRQSKHAPTQARHHAVGR